MNSADSAREAHAPLLFDFHGPEGRVFSSQTTRGRVTLIALITTYDMASQVLVRRLEELYRGHRPRLNVGAVVLEAARYEVLVSVFPTTLGLSYPVVMADSLTLAGQGTFGERERIPTLFVLDAEGGVSHIFENVPEIREIKEALVAAEQQP